MLIYCLFRPPAQRCSKHGYLSDTHSLINNLQFNKNSWMASLSPSPDKILSPLQMASLSPSPNGISKPIPASIVLTSANLRGTLVSNLLLPSRRERQTCQSNSSGARRLNRGNCCTPKFSLSFLQYFLTTRLLELKIKLGFVLLKTPPCIVDPN